MTIKEAIEKMVNTPLDFGRNDDKGMAGEEVYILTTYDKEKKEVGTSAFASLSHAKMTLEGLAVHYVGNDEKIIDMSEMVHDNYLGFETDKFAAYLKPEQLDLYGYNPVKIG